MNNKANRDVQCVKIGTMLTPVYIELVDAGKNKAAMRFRLQGSKQLFWIPKACLKEDGTVVENVDFVFRRISNLLTRAGYTDAIPGIKRATESDTVITNHDHKRADPEKINETIQALQAQLTQFQSELANARRLNEAEYDQCIKRSKTFTQNASTIAIDMKRLYSELLSY